MKGKVFRLQARKPLSSAKPISSIYLHQSKRFLSTKLASAFYNRIGRESSGPPTVAPPRDAHPHPFRAELRRNRSPMKNAKRTHNPSVCNRSAANEPIIEPTTNPPPRRHAIPQDATPRIRPTIQTPSNQPLAGTARFTPTIRKMRHKPEPPRPPQLLSSSAPQLLSSP
jgi:hypothetical protein